MKMGNMYDFGPNLAKNLENITIEVGGLAALRATYGSTNVTNVTRNDVLGPTFP